MKKTNVQFNYILLAVAVIGFMTVSSCKKNNITTFNPPRMFTPSGISVNGGDTAVTISWPASVNAPTSGVTYTVEINTDSTFQSSPFLSLKVDTVAVTVTDDTLQDGQRYFARVRANMVNGDSASYWMVDTNAFSLIGVQIFKPIQSTDIIDNEAMLNWTPSPNVSKIVITAPGGDTTQVAVSDSDNMAGQKLITGLMPSTQYTAAIYAGNKRKGLLTFTTLAALTGNIIDLRGITGDPQVLYDTLPQIASGSIVLLKRGLTYTIPSSYTIDRTVTIMSGLGFGTPATLLLSGNFDATGNIDSIRFADLTIANNDGNSDYFMNVGHTAVIGQMSVINCTTQGQYSNSFIRMKKAGDEIKNLTIDNCIIDSFGVASKYAVLYANASSSAVIDNITISNSTFYYFYYFIRQEKVAGTSLNIDHCTFDNMINQGGYFINYSGTFPTDFNITNCIFGATLDPTAANGIISSGSPTVGNCYATSDCVFSANPIPGTTAYAGSSTSLFANPGVGDFTIIDNSFAGFKTAGDPRWIP